MYTIYSTETCSYCRDAKNFLSAHELQFNEVKITSQETLQQLAEKLGYTPKTVPQIWLDDKYIGGYDDLVKSLKGDDIGG